MVRLEKHGDSAVRFIFTDSDHYLYKDGVVDVPVNSLSLVIDESEMVTFKKASTGDPFISFRLDKSNFSSRDELLTFYKENMVGAGGLSEEEVQQMIDAATSGIPSSEVVEQLRTDVNTLSGTVSSHTADTTVHFTGTQKSNYDGLEVLYHAEGNWDIMPQSAFNDFTNDYSTAMGQFDQRITANETAIATKADTSALTAVQDSLSGYVTTTTYESGQYATAQALNALQENKLDASAYTPTDLSQYWTSGQTQEAINAATSGMPSSQVIEALRNDINTVSGDVENKQDALSAGTGIEISGNVISATGGALLVNFDDLMENMNDEKWDELVDALQNNKPIFEGYNNSEGDITDAGQNIVDGYVYPDEYSDPDDEFGTITSIEVMSLTAYYAGGYRQLIITKKGSEDYEVSNYNDDYQPMGDYQPAMTAGSGISIDENYVISVTGAPITVDSELDETSNNPVANSAITNAIIDNEYTVSQAINSLNNRVAAVESGGSSINVVQTTGTSTTDVMSQDAVTDAFNTYTANRDNDEGIVRYWNWKTPNHPYGDNVLYNFSINGKLPLSKQTKATDYRNIFNFHLVETSAITSSITSASTNDEVAGAKAVYDAIQAGGGGGATYSAGTNIDITNDTINCTLPISAGTGTNSVVFNDSSNIGGTYEKNGQNSLSFGSYSKAHGIFAFAGGRYVNANNYGEMSVGFFNQSNGSSSAPNNNSGNTLFSVGNGTGTSARHNAFEIRQNGDIYIALNGQDVKLQDQLGGGGVTVDPTLDSGSTNPVANSAITAAIDDKQDALSAGTGISISNNVISTSGVVMSQTVTQLVKLTQAAYDTLATKDSSTLYIISD